jgi:hypothetical protein
VSSSRESARRKSCGTGAGSHEHDVARIDRRAVHERDDVVRGATVVVDLLRRLRVVQNMQAGLLVGGRDCARTPAASLALPGVEHPGLQRRVREMARASPGPHLRLAARRSPRPLTMGSNISFCPYTPYITFILPYPSINDHFTVPFRFSPADAGERPPYVTGRRQARSC